MSKYKVWCEDYGGSFETSDTINADCHIHAAEEWVRQYEQRHVEFPVGNGGSVVVYVVDALTLVGGAVERLYEVTGHAEPVYHARPVRVGVKL